MKKKTIFAFAVLVVMTLSIVAFAYTRTSVGSIGVVTAQSDDQHPSCPMKMKDSSEKGMTVDADKCEHCDHDSCPMKAKGDASQKVTSGSESGKPQGAAKSCDCPFCKAHHDNKSV